MSRKVSPEALEATREFIRDNPRASKETIRAHVKLSHPSAPSNKSILNLKEEIWGMSPNVALNGWKSAGFSKEEAEELVFGKKGVKVNWSRVYKSKPGQAARKTRTAWITDLRRRGWTWPQIRKEREAYYTRNKRRNPFDFIKAEYKPPKKVDYVEYRGRQRLRAKGKTRRGLYAKQQ